MTKKSKYKHLIEDMGLSYFLTNYRNLLCKIDDVYYSIIGVASKINGEIVHYWDEHHNDLTRPSESQRQQANNSHNLSDEFLFNYTNPSTGHQVEFEYKERYLLRPFNYEELLMYVRDTANTIRDLENNEPERFPEYEDEDGDLVESEETSDEWWDWKDECTTMAFIQEYYTRFVNYLANNNGQCALSIATNEEEEEPTTEDDETIEKLYIVCRKVESGSTNEYIHVSKLTSLSQFPRFRKHFNFPPLKKVANYPTATRGIPTDELMFKYSEFYLNPKYPTDLKSVIDQMRGISEGEFNEWNAVIMQNGMIVHATKELINNFELNTRITVSVEGVTVATVTEQGTIRASKSFINKFLQNKGA